MSLQAEVSLGMLGDALFISAWSSRLSAKVSSFQRGEASTTTPPRGSSQSDCSSRWGKGELEAKLLPSLFGEWATTRLAWDPGSWEIKKPNNATPSTPGSSKTALLHVQCQDQLPFWASPSPQVEWGQGMHWPLTSVLQ